MRITTSVTGDLSEWANFDVSSRSRPRLPIPYGLCGAFLSAGHQVQGVDLRRDTNAALQKNSLESVISPRQLSRALANSEAAIFWGSYALQAIVRERLSAKRSKILRLAYNLRAPGDSVFGNWKMRLQNQIASKAFGHIFMTDMQLLLAREVFGHAHPLIKFRCGIDTQFYRYELDYKDVPTQYIAIVEKLLTRPYVIMPGDELRLNDDAIKVAKLSGLRLVRISQYFEKSGTEKLNQEIEELGLQDLLLIFRKIDYKFLRFLLRNAVAYVGLVDSSWQPAGWTVACEALAAGVPAIIYEGLTTDELRKMGASVRIMRVVPKGDVSAVVQCVDDILRLAHDMRAELGNEARVLAEVQLDINVTGPDFVRNIELLVNS